MHDTYHTIFTWGMLGFCSPTNITHIFGPHPAPISEDSHQGLLGAGVAAIQAEAQPPFRALRTSERDGNVAMDFLRCPLQWKYLYKCACNDIYIYIIYIYIYILLLKLLICCFVLKWNLPIWIFKHQQNHGVRSFYDYVNDLDAFYIYNYVLLLRRFVQFGDAI